MWRFTVTRSIHNAACRTIKEMFPDASLQILFGCIGERAVERRRDIPDREECIRTAVSRMTKDDILLVTTKGSETSIKICGDIIPYPGDAVFVQEALRLR